MDIDNKKDVSNFEEYRVSDFRHPGISDDEAIHNCMQAALQIAPRTVIFDAPEYSISEAILLPPDTTIILDGCHIIQKDGTIDNVFRGDNVKPDPNNPLGMPLACLPTRNIRILGKNGATISGPHQNRMGFHPVLQERQLMVGDFWGWRTLTVSLSACNGFEIAGIRFDRSRCWTLSFDRCQNGHLHDLEIITDVKNGDGIDLRSGCHDIVIENICGITSDDTIACTAIRPQERTEYPSGNYLYPLEPTCCLPAQTPVERDIVNISIRHIRSVGSQHGIICLAAEGCRVKNVEITDICEEYSDKNVSANEKPFAREATVKLYTGYGKPAAEGDISDITISDVDSRYATYGVYSNTPLENCQIRNVRHTEGKLPVRLDYPDGVQVV